MYGYHGRIYERLAPGKDTTCFRCPVACGLGNLLAEGSVRLAAQLGPEANKYLYAVKGLKMPAHSARVLKGMSIGYATATRGGSHQDTQPTLQYATDHDNTTPAEDSRCVDYAHEEHL